MILFSFQKLFIYFSFNFIFFFHLFFFSLFITFLSILIFFFQFSVLFSIFSFSFFFLFFSIISFFSIFFFFISIFRLSSYFLAQVVDKVAVLIGAEICLKDYIGGNSLMWKMIGCLSECMHEWIQAFMNECMNKEVS